MATLTATPEGAALVPPDADDARLLLDAHILLKALYEVRYELTVRPAWVSWPLAAVAQMLPGDAQSSTCCLPSACCRASRHARTRLGPGR